MSRECFLAITSLTKIFGGLRALEDVHLCVEEGEMVGLIGPNGAGKTTLFNCVTGVTRPTAGDIYFGKKDVKNMPPHEITKLGMARTFQNIRLFSAMTALENVLVGMHCRGRGGVIGAILRTPLVRDEERRMGEKAHEILRFVGLAEKCEEWAGSLAYGDQRRLEIA